MLDFDEILVNIKNPQIKKYVAEAIKSYGVGNYRSAILAVWIAAMFDLVKKFEILVEQREPSAINKWKDLKPKIEDHDNWEQKLIDDAQVVAMISRYEANTLKELSKTRNRYAHPSFDDIGTLFDPSPEEVRYFIRTLYDIVLSQPAQLGAFYVTQLLEDIKNPNFFNKQLYAHDLLSERDIVIEKVKRINQKQLPRLIKELFQALNSPNSKEHEFNILSFVVNLWDREAELRLQNVSDYWNNYIANQELSVRTVQAIIDYPENLTCLNKLSNQSQQAIYKVIKNEFIKGRRHSIDFIKFLNVADVVPIAKSFLDEAPTLIIDKIIEKSWHYSVLLGNKFTELFGTFILAETRKALKTKNGYKVRPALSALRICGVWELANSLASSEQEEFANDLILSLNSRHFETMGLLSFSSCQDIPIKWIKLLLENWQKKLQTDTRIQQSLPNYLEHYLGLVEHYITELGAYSDIEDTLKSLAKLVESPSYLEKISELSSNEQIWTFWQKLLREHQSILVSTPLEDMIE